MLITTQPAILAWGLAFSIVTEYSADVSTLSLTAWIPARTPREPLIVAADDEGSPYYAHLMDFYWQ